MYNHEMTHCARLASWRVVRRLCAEFYLLGFVSVYTYMLGSDSEKFDIHPCINLHSKNHLVKISKISIVVCSAAGAGILWWYGMSYNYSIEACCIIVGHVKNKHSYISN